MSPSSFLHILPLQHHFAGVVFSAFPFKCLHSTLDFSCELLKLSTHLIPIRLSIPRCHINSRSILRTQLSGIYIQDIQLCLPTGGKTVNSVSTPVCSAQIQ